MCHACSTLRVVVVTVLQAGDLTRGRRGLLGALEQTPIHRLMVGEPVTSNGKNVHFGITTWSQPDWFWQYVLEEETKGCSGLAARFFMWLCPPHQRFLIEQGVEPEADAQQSAYEEDETDSQATTEPVEITEVKVLKVRTRTGALRGGRLTAMVASPTFCRWTALHAYPCCLSTTAMVAPNLARCLREGLDAPEKFRRFRVLKLAEFVWGAGAGGA